MTYDTKPNAPDEAKHRAQRLHEFAVNDLGLDTEDVLFTAYPNGTVMGLVKEGVAPIDDD